MAEAPRVPFSDEEAASWLSGSVFRKQTAGRGLPKLWYTEGVRGEPQVAQPTQAKLVLCLGLLMAIAAIQILPQVDLPDTTFHEDSSPQVTKSNVSVALFAVQPLSVLRLNRASSTLLERRIIAQHPSNKPLMALLSELRC
jgi:hypothetical protein